MGMRIIRNIAPVTRNAPKVELSLLIPRPDKIPRDKIPKNVPESLPSSILLVLSLGEGTVVFPIHACASTVDWPSDSIAPILQCKGILIAFARFNVCPINERLQQV
jgi:hypothetical protein